MKLSSGGQGNLYYVPLFSDAFFAKSDENPRGDTLSDEHRGGILLHEAGHATSRELRRDRLTYKWAMAAGRNGVADLALSGPPYTLKNADTLRCVSRVQPDCP